VSYSCCTQLSTGLDPRRTRYFQTNWLLQQGDILLAAGLVALLQTLGAEFVVGSRLITPIYNFV
jgi:hypothetical protein